MWIVKVALSRPYTFVVLALLIFILSPIMIVRTPTDIFPSELVASFPSRRRCLQRRKWQGIGSYEGDAVRKMGGILAQHMGQVCADRHVFWLVCS
jgi:hypothetical protein